MKRHKTFATERLLLKPISLEDAELVFELLNSPKWVKYIGDRNIKSIKDAKKYIRTKMLPQLIRIGFSVYTLVIKQNNKDDNAINDLKPIFIRNNQFFYIYFKYCSNLTQNL